MGCIATGRLVGACHLISWDLQVFITRLLPLLLLIGCGYNKVYKDPSGVYKKDFETLSESPCIDGAIVNIYEAGCEVF